MSEEKTIQVDVWLEMRVTYKQTITMPISEFKRLDALAEDGDEYQVAEELVEWLDLMDISDSDNAMLNDFRPAKGEVDPRDEPEIESAE